MAEDIVIRAEGLGKKYVIGHQTAERVPTLRDAMARMAHNFARTTRDLLRGKPLIAGDEVEEFWALRDVDFEIRRGDVVGIIGRNGAGKSTLLKVLSRITEPTEGRVEIKGRVASLLEVGTGFHPELTGRENIYLNGAILGMTRAEIRRKFDEIVAFAEIEKFLDTPVKRYSSGMYVRLAFAVAAHLEPEILIVDEVLAVGDAEFQKKCLGKMEDVAGHGRTVIFVSHNMAAISRLCRTGIYMSAGKATLYQDIQAAQAQYFSGVNATGVWVAKDNRRYSGFTPIRFEQVPSNIIILQGILSEARSNLIIAICLRNAEGVDLFWTTHRDGVASRKLNSGICEFHIELPSFISPGEYTATLSVFYHNEQYIIEPASGPSIAVSIPRISRGSEFFDVERKGLVSPLIEWTYATTK